MSLMRWIQDRLGWTPPPRDGELPHLFRQVEQIERQTIEFEQRVREEEERRKVQRLQNQVDLQRRGPQRKPHQGGISG